MTSSMKHEATRAGDKVSMETAWRAETNTVQQAESSRGDITRVIVVV